MSVIYDPNKKRARGFKLRRRSAKPAQLQPPAQSQPQPRPVAAMRPPRTRRRLPKLPRVSWRLAPGPSLVAVILIAITIGGTWHYTHRGGSGAAAKLAAGGAVFAPSPVYLTAGDAVAKRPLGISMVVSRKWIIGPHGPDAAQLLNPSDYQVALLDLTTGANSIGPNGLLAIENVTVWANVNDTVSSQSVSLPLNMAEKQAYLNYLIGLHARRSVSDGAAAVPPVSGETGQRTDLRYVGSADGKLSGVLYVASVANGSPASPHVVADLAGLINSQDVLVRLSIALDDGGSSQADITSATKLLQSLTLDTSALAPQAPAIVH